MADFGYLERRFLDKDRSRFRYEERMGRRWGRASKLCRVEMAAGLRERDEECGLEDARGNEGRALQKRENMR